MSNAARESDRHGERVREIFDAAADLDPALRTSFLDSQCGGDPELRRQVEQLLSHDSHQTVPFLVSPLARHAERSGRLEVGGVIADRYRVVQHVDDGGMGEVYLCEQERPVKRRVAVKLIKPGMDSREVLTRFEQERQTLALLNHPNVATVFDAGVTDAGRPYFVMEYVDGRNVARFCDEHQLTVRKRLTLFLEICDAVQHAHQKGVIHRDIKPSNILIAGDNGTPHAKVIDFGVAKALGDESPPGAQTLVGQFIGTPAYMSPEQAAGDPVDTRTDVYSLGVLLFELLTGTTPLDMQSRGSSSLEDVLRSIRDEEPVRPSTRLRTADDQAAMKFAESRASDRQELIRLLRGDLDWITLKATEKEIDRRYPSVTDLAEDIRRHLRHLPVSAGPPGVRYTLGKFVRRNRAAVIGLAAVFAVLVAGIAATGFALREARLQRDEAEHQRDQAQWQAYVATIAAAESALRQHDVVGAEARLNAADPTLRNWEWRYLNALLDESTRTIPIETSFRSTVALSPDGLRVACQGSGGVIEVRDLAGGEVLARHDDHGGAGIDFCFAPDGRTIASVSGQEFHLWDSHTGELIRTFTGHRGVITRVDFSPDGDLLLTADDYATARTWNVATGEPLRVYGGFNSPIYHASFSHDGTRIAASYRDYAILIWDVHTGDVIHDFRDEIGIGPAIAFSPDDRFLVSGSDDQTLRIRDLSTGGQVSVLRGHTGNINEVAYSPDGARIASVSDDRTLRTWDATTGAPLEVFVGSRHEVRAMDWTIDGSTIVTNTGRGSLQLWDAHVEPVHRTLQRPAGVGTSFDSFADLAVSPDGRMIAACTRHGVYVWSRISKQLLTGMRPSPPASRIRFTGDGSKLAVLTGNKFTIFDSKTFATVADLPLESYIGEFEFLDANGTVIAMTEPGSGIKIWEPESGVPPRTVLTSDQDPGQLAASRAGDVIAATYGRRTIRIVDIASGSTLNTFECPSDVQGMAFCNQGRRLVTAGGDGILRAWEIAQGRVENEIHIAGLPGRLLFNADESRLFVAQLDGAIAVCAWPTGEELIVLRSYSRLAHHALTPDERLLVSASIDGFFSLWPTESVANLHLAKQEYDKAEIEMAALIDTLATSASNPTELVEQVDRHPDLTDMQRDVAHDILVTRFTTRQRPRASGEINSAAPAARTRSTDGSRPNDS